jgi:hypothetical protein
LLQPKKPWKTGIICGYITNLKQSILEAFDIYDLNPHNKECHTAEGKLTGSYFYAQLKFVNFPIWQQKMSQLTVVGVVFNEDFKLGLPFLYLLYLKSYCEKIEKCNCCEA